MNTIKRKLKRAFAPNSQNLKNIPLKLFIISFIFFISIQFYINSSLSTQGVKLQSLNTEKTLLLQENREIEKDLANARSITVVENLTNKKYKLTPTKTGQLVYVSATVNALK